MPWFKVECRTWLDGTRDLDPAIRGIYIDVLCLIYDRGGPVPDDERWISHQLHISLRRWRAARDVLMACGKLVASQHGLITEEAKIELENREIRQRINAENGAKNARKNHENSNFVNVSNQRADRTAQQNSFYACARENLESESDIDSDLNGPNGIDDRPLRIPQTWRTHDLEFLLSAAPSEKPHELVRWLWLLEDALGADAVTAALQSARPRIEAGDVKHVLQYVTTAANNWRHLGGSKKRSAHVRGTARSFG
ncbi:MAG: DUF1376 domain-containing protein [Hyphomicrobium sp.]|uniref:DUF1376 domain-containing protein n=1 Tax=Hyphomicrobium sp. TaxID=82 RepID=UPI00356784C1